MSDLRNTVPPKLIVPTAMPAGVWVLGFVSMLMDISSEMIHSLLPLFLVGTLGVSVLTVDHMLGQVQHVGLGQAVFADGPGY